MEGKPGIIRKSLPPIQSYNYTQSFSTLPVDGEGEVVELRALWGKVLNHDILLPNRSLVFDFGSELYLWNGKQASAKQRSKGTAFLKKLAEDGNVGEKW